MNSLSTDILHKLQLSHRGRERAISAEDLARYLSRQEAIPERAVRRAVHELRLRHIPVCSDPKIGFWWPESREDAAPAVANLRKQFQPIRDALEGLEAGLDETFGPATLFDQEEVA